MVVNGCWLLYILVESKVEMGKKFVMVDLDEKNE